MAKRKAAKKIQLRYITDPRHGWGEVPATLAKKIGIGTDFPCRDGMLYLEEDCEMSDCDRALKKAGYKADYVESYVDDFDAWLDGDVWPAIPEHEANND